MDRTRHRTPQLSEKPERHTGRYYAAYRDDDGKPKRKRFTKDRKESEHLYHLWLAERSNPDIEIISRQAEADKPVTDTSLVAVSSAYLERQGRRVRGFDDDHKRGTVNQQTCDDIRRQVLTIVEWTKKNLGVRFRSTDLGSLFTVSEYEDMFLDFTKRWGPSFVNKLRQRFWDMVRFAAREPYRVQLSLTRDDVRMYGGNDTKPSRRALPTVSDLKKILKAATHRERTWIWLALGCAFGPQDIARCKPIHFDKHNFDLRRGKTGVDRYGPMFPRVWAQLKAYLHEHPTKPNDLVFTTSDGHPIVIIRSKQSGDRAGKVSYTKSSALRNAWVRLLERSGSEWSGGFYTLRHLGGTAYGSRPKVSVVALRDFMGHTSIETTNRYLRAVTPQNRQLMAWITKSLDSVE